MNGARSSRNAEGDVDGRRGRFVSRPDDEVPDRLDLRRCRRPGPRRGARLARAAHTMIGMKRLANVRTCVEQVLADGIPGDLIETGVWRGGATIFMRAILKAHGIADRVVWVADSFAGLPPPSTACYPHDEGIRLHQFPQLAVPLERVRENFRRYGLLDDQVRFLKGWFRDTLPTAPIGRLAVARLDGDLYESTIQALDALYPKVSPGGFVIVDDYGNVAACRQAVHDFRAGHGIDDAIQRIDWGGVYWRRSPTAGGTVIASDCSNT